MAWLPEFGSWIVLDTKTDRAFRFKEQEEAEAFLTEKADEGQDMALWFVFVSSCAQEVTPE